MGASRNNDDLPTDWSSSILRTLAEMEAEHELLEERCRQIRRVLSCSPMDAALVYIDLKNAVAAGGARLGIEERGRLLSEAWTLWTRLVFVNRCSLPEAQVAVERWLEAR